MLAPCRGCWSRALSVDCVHPPQVGDAGGRCTSDIGHTSGDVSDMCFGAARGQDIGRCFDSPLGSLSADNSSDDHAESASHDTNTCGALIYHDSLDTHDGAPLVPVPADDASFCGRHAIGVPAIRSAAMSGCPSDTEVFPVFGGDMTDDAPFCGHLAFGVPAIRSAALSGCPSDSGVVPAFEGDTGDVLPAVLSSSVSSSVGGLCDVVSFADAYGFDYHSYLPSASKTKTLSIRMMIPYMMS